MAQQSFHQRSDLKEIARRAMVEHDLEPDFSKPVQAELDRITGAAATAGEGIRDLSGLPWCSIDNDDSRDLDQLSVSESLPGGAVKVFVAVADVDAVVKKDTAIDQHARHNTTSVYTAAEIFPMLPEKLSTDVTSLNENQDRLAMVVEMTVAADGSLGESVVYRAAVHNRAKLAYDAVSAWLGGGPAPRAVTRGRGVDEQLRVQDAGAQKVRGLRFEEGALDLETLQPKAIFDGETVVALREEPHNRARQLIEDFMIAANGVTARFLASKGVASLRGVVRPPDRWQRIVEVAKELGEHLPPEPDSKALSEFLAKRRQADPDRFPDLSLVIVKLMGAGEYIVERPGQVVAGHFGLAVKDYTHSTAPNRRFPDLITQRLLKAALAGRPTPYADGELGALAVHCTEQEDAADKVERQVRKSAAALLLEKRGGDRVDAIVTGAAGKGRGGRGFDPPGEGGLVYG